MNGAPDTQASDGDPGPAGQGWSPDEEWCRRPPGRSAQAWSGHAPARDDQPEPDLVPYRPVSLQGLRRLLVLAPHPDDETFGCGGLIARAFDAGVQVRVVVVSDGGLGGDAAQRRAECRAALHALGPGDDAVEFWGAPDRAVSRTPGLPARLQSLLQTFPADWLMAPSPWEVHLDHRAVCALAIEAAATPQAPLLGFYEVGQPLLPNRLLDVSAVAARKHAAMAAYASQLVQQRYDAQLQGLSCYRGYTLGPQCSHAEAFWFPGRPDQHDAEAMRRQLETQLRRRWPAGVPG